ncbi:putative TetR-family regulatory protein [Gordonia spumicola]|uniref:Putative TetR-family regulatory protein n=1 Tax=Gordonia spumicola TaxID=589161 RepID=A0A7I9VCQ9_9ACTN|nr:TetR/AcrR family transcriptional regulator [Gordonia spumicola]GEE03156.1 putative TetR-family regulatory protein [Gordonia spumicola]
MAKGEQTRARTVARFLEAGADVFADRGFHAATMAQICERAGLSRGAFYSNFDSKESLFLALFEQHAATQLDAVASAFENAPDFDTAVSTAVGAAVADPDAEHRWFLISTEFTIYAARNADAARLLVEHDTRVRSRLATTIARFATGDAAAQPSEDDLEAARFAIALYEGVQLGALVERDAYQARRTMLRFLPLGVKNS